MTIIEASRSERDFAFDVRRAIILANYIRHWGMPKFRQVAHKGQDRIEIYQFPGRQKGHPIRLATIGVSALFRENGRQAGWELLFALPGDFTDASVDESSSFLFDIAAYSLKMDVDFHPEATIPETALAPRTWSARALLVDEARGEPEELGSFHVGEQHVDLLWLVPIYGSERDYILRDGIDAFDRACQARDVDLSDPRRPPLE